MNPFLKKNLHLTYPREEIQIFVVGCFFSRTELLIPIPDLELFTKNKGRGGKGEFLP